MMPAVSVIVPHYQSPQALDQCLSALEVQSYPRDAFEIVVADNASPMGLPAVQAIVRGRARVVLVEEAGAGPARNGGVAASCGDILAFTDADCLPERGWLESGIAALGDAGYVGGRMKVLVDDPARPSAAEAFETIFAFRNGRYVREEGFTVTANLFVRRRDFDRVGGFRTGVSEDKEWCHRATASGLRIAYAPDAVVGHPARRDWAELQRKWKRLNAESFALSMQSPAGRLRWGLRNWALPAAAVINSVRALASDGMRPSDRLRAVLILNRLYAWRFVDAHRLLFGKP